MKCFNHNSIDSVALCKDCNKEMCFTCASKFSIPICPSCNNNRIDSENGKIIEDFIKIFILTIVFSVIYINGIGFQNSPFSYKAFLILFSFYFSSSIIVGWRTLNRFTPRVFLFLPLIGWLIYFILKLYASAIVGMFISPIWLFKKFRRLYILLKVRLAT